MNLITKSVRVKVTTEEVADLFCSMDSDEQVAFFNEVASLVKDWKFTFGQQLSYVALNHSLSKDARAIMNEIGQWSKEYPEQPEPEVNGADYHRDIAHADAPGPYDQ